MTTAYTTDEFLEEYPHFSKLDRNWIGIKLAFAKAMNSESAFGAQWRLAVGLQTAHLLSLDPQGQQARLDPEDTETTYGVEYQALKNACTAGPRVI